AGLSAPPAPEAARARWATRLARTPQPARLLGRAGKLSVSLGEEQYLRLHRTLGEGKARALEARLAAHGVGWAAAAHAAWALVLSRHGNGSAVRFGTVVAGRSALADAQTAVGMFIDVLPVVVPVPEVNGAPGWLREVQAELRALSSDEGTPREWLHAAAHVGATEALYESILVVDPALDGLLASAPGLTRTQLSVEWTGHPVHVSLRPTPEVELDLTLQRSAFTEEEGHRLLQQFATALEAVASDGSVGALDVLDASEHALLDAQRDERRPPSTGEDYPAALAAAAARGPERLAVSDATQEWTAARLEREVGALAGALRARGVRAETLVGVLAERDARFLALAAGILQAEGVYVPLDPSHPPARWREVAQRGRLSAVVADGPCAARLGADFPVPVWPLESLAGAPPFRGRPRPGSLAYVLHTSGSTGAPKGAMAEHAGFLNHSDLLVEQLGLNADDVLAQTAPQSFDISVWQMLTPFTVGARVHVVATEVVRDPRALVAELERVGATVVQLVPSLLRAMVDDLAASGRARPLASLRWCIPTGEALPPELARDWFALFPHVPLLNAYGPAECSDDVTLAVLRAPLPPGAPMSIGRPVKGASLAVLDERGRAVPYGAPGELVLGGLVVGRGYLGAPELTAERFVPDPARPGARRYRTGDLVRFDRTGELVFLGRVDHQVKIRGQRIELGEVEAALRRQPSVQDALALVTPHPSGEPHLAAYVLPAPGLVPAPGWEAELKRAVAQELTSAMVPSQLVRLERWPLTANGKVNRAALPPITWSSARAPAREAADELEHAVLEVARAQLGAPALGPDDDFFDAGGSSLLAVKVLAGLEQRLGRRLRLDAFFEHPSAAGLASLLRAAPHRGPVVTLRGLGARRPLVLVPGGLGEPAVFRDLA
ncbi:MAG: amino acid adenylation domain-containing protein, partial [Myxococcaceae bacterium]|nr:amino acid adenylation domain-containing protein [Myxococcaceae bacterium]